MVVLLIQNIHPSGVAFGCRLIEDQRFVLTVIIQVVEQEGGAMLTGFGILIFDVTVADRAFQSSGNLQLFLCKSRGTHQFFCGELELHTARAECQRKQRQQQFCFHHRKLLS